MKDYGCIHVRVSQIENHIQEAAEEANVKIESETLVFSMGYIFQPETLATLNLTVTLLSSKQLSATVEVIYDHFGFVGVHIYPSKEYVRLGVKPRKAKGSLNRVIKTFINQLIAIEGSSQQSIECA